MDGCAGSVGNPFYSEKVQQDLILAATRPMDLPSPPSTEGKLPLHDVPVETPVMRSDGNTGKGRGGGEPAGGSKAFVTPESKRGCEENEGGAKSVKLHQTQGAMPTTSVDETMEGGKSMGTIPHVKVDGQNADGVEAVASRTADDDGLQRVLEREMVEHLQQQNQMLIDEIAALRKQHACQQNTMGSTRGTSTSWSEVGEPHREVDPGSQSNSKPARDSAGGRNSAGEPAVHSLRCSRRGDASFVDAASMMEGYDVVAEAPSRLWWNPMETIEPKGCSYVS